MFVSIVHRLISHPKSDARTISFITGNSIPKYGCRLSNEKSLGTRNSASTARMSKATSIMCKSFFASPTMRAMKNATPVAMMAISHKAQKSVA